MNTQNPNMVAYSGVVTACLGGLEQLRCLVGLEKHTLSCTPLPLSIKTVGSSSGSSVGDVKSATRRFLSRDSAPVLIGPIAVISRWASTSLLGFTIAVYLPATAAPLEKRWAWR